MEQHQAVAEENGILLVGISMGEAKHIQRYCDKLAPNIMCLVGKDNEPYQAYGLEQASGKEMLSLDVAKGLMRAISKGHTGGAAIGDVKMMPGSFLVDMAGVIRAVHYNKNIGDHSDLGIMLGTLS